MAGLHVGPGDNKMTGQTGLILTVSLVFCSPLISLLALRVLISFPGFSL